MTILRLGVMEAWQLITTQAQFDRVKAVASAIRLYYDAGSDWTASAAHARAVQAQGLWALPALNQTGTSLSGWNTAVNSFLATQPFFQYIETGNEPRIPNYPLYFQQLAAASPLIRAKGSKVMLAAAWSSETDQFLSTFTNWGAVDAVAVHIYGQGDPVTKLARWRGMIPSTKPIFVTEFGWAAGGGFGGTETDQAQKLTTLVQNVIKVAPKYNVQMLSWFTWKDRKIVDPSYFDYAGLIRPDGTAKAAYFTMRKFDSTVWLGAL